MSKVPSLDDGRGDGTGNRPEIRLIYLLCPVLSDTCQLDFASQLSVYGGVKDPSEPLSRQDLYVGLMTTFGSRSGGTVKTAAEGP